jgi:hypothetical protein
MRHGRMSDNLESSNSHLEQADTGRDTRSNGLSEKLERGIARLSYGCF